VNLMHTMQIVGLTGKAGAGKDTAAAMLCEALQARGKRTKTMAFAEPIRAALMAMGVPSSYIYERRLKETEIPGWGASYRKLAQTLGTEWGCDQIGKDLWVRLLADRLVEIGMVSRLPDVVVITDVRLQNEADWIKTRLGLLVHVVRPDVGEVRGHISEAGVQGVDQMLRNDGDLQNLRSCCGQLSNLVLAKLALQGIEA
jgi:hypothetical protein